MTYEPQRSTEIQEFRKEQYEVIFRQLKPPDDSEGSYPGFAPGLTVKNGIRAEYEVAVPMRDGTIIYADIFRPDDVNNIPAIISWSPYGKRRGWWTDVSPRVPRCAFNIFDGATKKGYEEKAVDVYYGVIAREKLENLGFGYRAVY